MKYYLATIKDVGICEKIFVPDIYALKVNTELTTPKDVVNDYIDTPQELKDKHQNIELCANINIFKGGFFLLPYPRKLSSLKSKISQIVIFIY